MDLARLFGPLDFCAWFLELDVLQRVQRPFAALGVVDDFEGVELEGFRGEGHCFLVRSFLQEAAFELGHARLQPSIEIACIVLHMQVSLIVSKRLPQQQREHGDCLLGPFEKELGGGSQQTDSHLIREVLWTEGQQFGSVLDEFPKIANQLNDTATRVLLFGMFGQGVEDANNEGEFLRVKSEVGADKRDNAVTEQWQRSGLYVLYHCFGDEFGIGFAGLS